MTEIKCLTIDELKAALKDMGEKPFRAGQIFKWLHEGVQSFDEMSNLSKELRARHFPPENAANDTWQICPVKTAFPRTKLCS